MSAAQASLFGISRVEMLREVERQIAVLEAVAALLARIEVAA